MSNFKEIARILIAQQAACQIEDTTALIAKTLELLRTPDLRAAISKSSLAVIQDNCGAVSKIADTVGELLQHKPTGKPS